tara:strand:+ start:467 stop:700 length:234 start_codon:yes stop_codon:yes gene_type:complete
MYDNILRNRESILETLLIESIDDKQKLVEVFKVVAEVLNYADELSFENSNFKLQNMITQDEYKEAQKIVWDYESQII